MRLNRCPGPEYSEPGLPYIHQKSMSSSRRRISSQCCFFCSSMAILLTCRSMMPQGEYTNCYLTRSWRKNCAAVNKESGFPMCAKPTEGWGNLQEGGQSYHSLRRSLDISPCGSSRISQVFTRCIPENGIYIYRKNSAGLMPEKHPRKSEIQKQLQKRLIFFEYQAFWWRRWIRSLAITFLETFFV